MCKYVLNITIDIKACVFLFCICFNRASYINENVSVFIIACNIFGF